jgi:1-acyl-sn-glycerol-3-phosphate acyltransferase
MLDWLANRWYDLCCSVTWTAMTTGWSLRFEGSRHVPRSGPVLLVANHQSFLDPPLVAVCVARRLSFLARKSLFKNRFLGGLIRSLKAYPVDQEGVAAAGLKETLDLLERGKAVLAFPEGERTWTGEMQPFKAGVALLIRRAVPAIVPVGIAGAFAALPRTAMLPRWSPIFLPPTGSAIAVSIGQPLDAKRFAAMPREEMLAALSREVRQVQLRAERLRRKG